MNISNRADKVKEALRISELLCQAHDYGDYGRVDELEPKLQELREWLFLHKKATLLEEYLNLVEHNSTFPWIKSKSDDNSCCICGNSYYNNHSENCELVKLMEQIRKVLC